MLRFSSAFNLTDPFSKGSVYFAVKNKIACRSILSLVTWISKRHFVLECHDFAIAQWIDCSV